jgi:hypothetical protein
MDSGIYCCLWYFWIVSTLDGHNSNFDGSWNYMVFVLWGLK